MADGDPGEIEAGPFSAWLAGIESGAEMDVPCGTCTACCRSSYFIHVEPDETDTIRRIPKRLLFPAPGRPPGHRVLGFDDRGHCPMLTDAGCSIYEDRPRTCRSYDCRVFPATGLSAEDDGKLEIAARATRWRFDLDTEPRARSDFDAVRRAARYLVERADACFADGAGPVNNGQRAALAIKVHRLFLGDGEPEPDAVRAALGAT